MTTTAASGLGPLDPPPVAAAGSGGGAASAASGQPLGAFGSSSLQPAAAASVPTYSFASLGASFTARLVAGTPSSKNVFGLRHRIDLGTSVETLIAEGGSVSSNEWGEALEYFIQQAHVPANTKNGWVKARKDILKHLLSKVLPGSVDEPNTLSSCFAQIRDPGLLEAVLKNVPAHFIDPKYTSRLDPGACDAVLWAVCNAPGVPNKEMLNHLFGNPHILAAVCRGSARGAKFTALDIILHTAVQESRRGTIDALLKYPRVVDTWKTQGTLLEIVGIAVWTERGAQFTFLLSFAQLWHYLVSSLPSFADLPEKQISFLLGHMRNSLDNANPESPADKVSWVEWLWRCGRYKAALLGLFYAEKALIPPGETSGTMQAVEKDPYYPWVWAWLISWFI